MKKCKECGFENDDSRTMCCNCGSTTFEQAGGDAKPRVVPVETKPAATEPTQRPAPRVVDARGTTSRSNTSRTHAKVEWWPELPDGAKPWSIAALTLVGIAIVAYIVYWLIPAPLTVVDRTDDLVVYTPHYSRVELEVGVLPQASNDSIIYCAAAALTGEELSEFKHKNISGDHVSHGELSHGYKSGVNTGVFTWADGEWHYGTAADADSLLREAANAGGMGFMQDLLINGGTAHNYRTGTRHKLECRALCVKDGKLRIIDSAEPETIDEFVDDLVNYGVEYAIALTSEVPGKEHPWNQAWYRTTDKPDAVYIQEKPQPHGTNWIAFYK